MTSSTPPSLKELVTLFICEHASCFAQTSFEGIPETTTQELCTKLCATQSMTLPMLLQLKNNSHIRSMNLCGCGRVTNEWMILLRDMHLTNLNLGHCLVTNDAMYFLKKKRKKYKPSPKKDQGKRKNGHSPKNKKRKGKKEEETTVKKEVKPLPPLEEYAISKTLTSLNLSFVGMLTEDGVRCIASNFKNLKMLSLEGCRKIGNKALEIIGTQMPHLVGLNVKHCQKISGQGFQFLKHLNELEVLNISDCEKLTSESVNNVLPYLKNLIYLNMRFNTKITNLDSLKDNIHLRTLDISGLSELKSLDFIKECTSLTSLAMSETAIDDEEFSVIAGLSQLKCIDVGKCAKLSPITLGNTFDQLTTLTNVNLRSTSANDYTIECLDCSKELQSLNISQCSNITNEGFQKLNAFSSLVELHARQMNHITTGWKTVFNSLLKLRVLDIAGSFISIDDKYLHCLNQLTNMQSLDISNNKGVDDSIMEVIQDLSSLTWLDLSHTSISSKGMNALKKLEKLSSLSIASCPNITREGITLVRFNTKLQSLDISNSKIDDKSIVQLTPLSNLTHLSMINCKKITDIGIKEISNHFSKLISLNIYGIMLTDCGVSYLRKLQNMNTLKMSTCELITEKGYNFLHEIPNLVYLKTQRLELVPLSYQIGNKMIGQ